MFLFYNPENAGYWKGKLGFKWVNNKTYNLIRDWSRTAATFKMERFVIIVNSFQPFTIITNRSILDVAAVLDPPLISATSKQLKYPENFNLQS